MFKRVQNKQSRLMNNHFPPKQKSGGGDMISMITDVIPQAIGIMQEKGITGSKEELHELLNEHGIPIEDFVKKAKGVLRNPLYVGALKKANAPVEDIKNIIYALSGEEVTAVKGNVGAMTNRTKFKRI